MRFHKVKAVVRSTLLLICGLAIPGASFAANHFVRAGATGTGSNWTDAFGQLPATLVRGDTYYLAAGTYPPYSFNTPQSGTTLITIKKATVSDHGTDTGWQASYATGPAVFSCGVHSCFDIMTGYLVLDGKTRTTPRSGHGIKIDATTCNPPPATNFCWNISFDTGINTVTIRYVEIRGKGLDDKTSLDSNIRSIGIGETPGSGVTNLTLQYLYIHDSSGDPIDSGQGQNLTLEYSVFSGNSTDPINHGQAWADQGSSDVTIRYNIFEDIEGTGYLVVLNRGGQNQTAGNWNIYGNVFSYSNGNPTSRTGVGDGVIACINGEICPNWSIYQNTIANLPNSGNAGMLCNPCGGASRIVENNLWFGNAAVVSMNLQTLKDYNTYLNTLGESGFSPAPHELYVPTGSVDPFVSLLSSDFHLVQPTAPGIALSAPYDFDPDGNARGGANHLGPWSRGAYEFASGLTRPDAPRNLRVTQVQ